MQKVIMFLTLTVEDIKRFWSFVNIKGPKECWVWQGGGSNNLYGNFSIGPRISAKTYLAHRISYLIEYGPTELFVCHKCDNTRCVNPKHLFADTQKDNRLDCKNKNRVAKGEKHGRAILTREQVLDIVKLSKKIRYGHRVGLKQIAKLIGCNSHTVRNILNGSSWNWLTGIKKIDDN